MQQFRGQDHILQRMTPIDLGLPDELRSSAATVLNDKRVMLFEFAKYGSLASLLKKACVPTSPGSSQFRPLPDRVLIHIFHCREFSSCPVWCVVAAAPDLQMIIFGCSIVVEGCIAMAAPRNIGGPPNPHPVVHFDLEPSNGQKHLFN